MRKRSAATAAALITACAVTGALTGAAVATPGRVTDGNRAEKTVVATATRSVTHEENERVPEGALDPALLPLLGRLRDRAAC